MPSATTNTNGTSHSADGASKGPAKVSIDWSTFHNTINGKLSPTKEALNGTNPSNLESLPAYPKSTLSDVNAAVSAANAAFPSWSATPLEKRSALLQAFADLAFKTYASDIMSLLAEECGKPPQMTQTEVGISYQNLSLAATLKLDDEVYEDDEKIITTQWVPIGVIVGIVPWNFPLILGLQAVCSGLGAGNCVILKPSPFTPYSALKMVEIGQQIFPPGVLQCLAGDETLGPMLVSHADVHKIAFTGSIATGKRILAECAKTLKRCTVELGGNDACIVCEDVADVEYCASQVAVGSFINSGQLCMATKRVYVHEKIYDRFKKAMTEFTKNALVLGPASQEGVMVGPVQNRMQYEKVSQLVDGARRDGYDFLLGGEAGEVEKSGKGFFITPSIVANPPKDSSLVVDEQFGKSFWSLASFPPYPFAI